MKFGIEIEYSTGYQDPLNSACEVSYQLEQTYGPSFAMVEDYNPSVILGEHVALC